MLKPIIVPSSIDTRPIPSQIHHGVASARQRIESFQDSWQRNRIEQFVAADYDLVYQALTWLMETQPLIGKRFVEWGCGFAVVSAMASQLGFDAIGIESESELLHQGEQTVQDWGVPVELVHGNFLPHGAESLADDPTLPSLGHEVDSAYRQLEMELDDFALVYAYPWPGEDEFHVEVFDRYAATGAMLLLFRGPNDVQLWRKT